MLDAIGEVLVYSLLAINTILLIRLWREWWYDRPKYEVWVNDELLLFRSSKVYRAELGLGPEPWTLLVSQIDSEGTIQFYTLYWTSNAPIDISEVESITLAKKPGPYQMTIDGHEGITNLAVIPVNILKSLCDGEMEISIDGGEYHKPPTDFIWFDRGYVSIRFNEFSESSFD